MLALGIGYLTPIYISLTSSRPIYRLSVHSSNKCVTIIKKESGARELKGGETVAATVGL